MVVKAGDPEATIYQSDPTPARNLLTSPDATAGLFAMRPGCFQGAVGGPGARSFLPGAFPRNRGSDILTQKPTA